MVKFIWTKYKFQVNSFKETISNLRSTTSARKHNVKMIKVTMLALQYNYHLVCCLDNKMSNQLLTSESQRCRCKLVLSKKEEVEVTERESRALKLLNTNTLPKVLLRLFFNKTNQSDCLIKMLGINN